MEVRVLASIPDEVVAGPGQEEWVAGGASVEAVADSAAGVAALAAAAPRGDGSGSGTLVAASFYRPSRGTAHISC
ncbi:MAG TPA: hypothetical protein VF243_03820, partial [Nitrosospira sp.]